MDEEDLVDGADHLDHYHFCLCLRGERHFAMLSEVAVIRWIVSGYLESLEYISLVLRTRTGSCVVSLAK